MLLTSFVICCCPLILFRFTVTNVIGCLFLSFDGHRKRVCTESWLLEKNPLPHKGIEPASAACRSDALPTELHSHAFLLLGPSPVSERSLVVCFFCFFFNSSALLKDTKITYHSKCIFLFQKMVLPQEFCLRHTHTQNNNNNNCQNA